MSAALFAVLSMDCMPKFYSYLMQDDRFKRVGQSSPFHALQLHGVDLKVAVFTYDGTHVHVEMLFDNRTSGIPQYKIAQLEVMGDDQLYSALRVSVDSRERPADHTLQIGPGKKRKVVYLGRNPRIVTLPKVIRLGMGALEVENSGARLTIGEVVLTLEDRSKR